MSKDTQTQTMPKPREVSATQLSSFIQERMIVTKDTMEKKWSGNEGDLPIMPGRKVTWKAPDGIIRERPMTIQDVNKDIVYMFLDESALRSTQYKKGYYVATPDNPGGANIPVEYWPPPDQPQVISRPDGSLLCFADCELVEDHRLQQRALTAKRAAAVSQPVVQQDRVGNSGVAGIQHELTATHGVEVQEA